MGQDQKIVYLVCERSLGAFSFEKLRESFKKLPLHLRVFTTKPLKPIINFLQYFDFLMDNSSVLFLFCS